MGDLRGKKLLILGGTRVSCEIIRAAQRMGIYTVVADYNKVEESPGKQIADESFFISVTDVHALVQLIQRENIEGVITGFSDLLLPYYADICQLAGLPAYGTREQFELFTEKKRYKALCRAFDIPTVKEYDLDLQDLASCEQSIRFPVIVKPADGSGARGITICETVQELQDAYSRAEAFSRDGNVLVEDYLSGKEATIFWTFQDGTYYLSGIGNRHTKKNQEGVIPLPIGYTFPSTVTRKYIETVADKARAMFRAVGLRDGVMFMQTKIENGTCIVYDIGFRLTGSMEYKLFEAVCGYNPLEMLIHFALTGRMAEESVQDRVNPFLGAYAYNVSFLAKPGRIRSYTGMEDLFKIPDLLDIVVEHEPGEEITEKMRGLLAQISLRVFGTAPTLHMLRERLLQVQHTVHILSDQGEEMLLPGFEPEDMDEVIGSVVQLK